ncbi:MAG: hypothetical protein ACREQP_00105 [Candidatus Binatia bacterium]
MDLNSPDFSSKSRHGGFSQPKSSPEKKFTAGIIYEALSATNAPIWLAQDLSLYDKHGLDMKVIHARGATPVQAVVSGSVEFGAFSGSSTVAGRWIDNGALKELVDSGFVKELYRR